MTKWTYKRLTVDIADVIQDGFEAKLDALGEEGWELVTMFDRERGGNSKECFFVFKKAK